MTPDTRHVPHVDDLPAPDLPVPDLPVPDVPAPDVPLPLATSAPFESIADSVARHARERPSQPALRDGEVVLDYAALDGLMDRVAATLQRDGVKPGDVVAVCGATSTLQAVVFLGALRAGAAVAPLAFSVTHDAFDSMLADAGASHLFVDAAARASLGPSFDGAASRGATACSVVSLDAHGLAFDDWLVAAGTLPRPVVLGPDAPFNIIYSSGTTGTPKGIVQSHGMRASHVDRALRYGYGPDTVTLLATPLYSNTTLVVFFPTLGFGGSVVLMPKFDAAAYLARAELDRATHTMLVPVQYQRVLASPTFGDHDLSSFRFKFCTSAPFSAALKADVLRRWPGELIEFYGMTEGGGTCILDAREHPDKLHTVGRPAEGHDIRLVDDDGAELPPGSTGEVVGHSGGMMTGYHRQAARTAEAEWFDAAGKRFIRTGDIGRFDDDGFLVLVDRKKDLIISGGFNIYPSDLEQVLLRHPDVLEAAVVGVPSSRWGETPVAFVVRRKADADADAEAIMLWLNQRVGKTQRLSSLHLVDELPRSAIGKVLKRELRDRLAAQLDRRD